MKNKIKLLKIFLLTIIPLSMLFIFFINQVVINKITTKDMIAYKNALMKEKKSDLLASVDIIKQNLFIKLENKKIKNFSKEELNLYKKEVIEYIDKMSVDEKNYYWISDKNMDIIFHPINKDFLNKNAKDLTSNLKIDQSQKNAFIEYTLTQKDKNVEKIAALSLFEPLNWVIGKAIEIPEINNRVKKTEETLLDNHSYTMSIFSIFLILFILSIIYIIIKKSNNSIFIPMENRMNTLTQKLEEKNIELQKRLYTDELTNLKNMNALKDDVKGKGYRTLFVIDIDSFNNINKLYGYQIGDAVLREYANILHSFSKEYQYKCYRLYSNTFALLGINNIIEVDKYHNDIKKLLTQYTKINFRKNIFYFNDIDITLDVNIGICLAQDNVIIKANTALEAAKKETKRYYVYNGDINEKNEIEKYINIKKLLIDAINNDGVIPYFQPILTQDKNIVKYESLMRLRVNNNIISPNMFMDVSIKTKLYSKLSIMMIEKALKKAKQFKIDISINLSTDDFSDQKLNKMLDKYLNKKNIELCKLITFEILESQSIDNFEIINTFLTKYRRFGVKIAIDDFGTGYSNFSNILLLKPNYIKIDGSLIKNIDTSNDSLILVKSIVSFAKTLNILTIAEFIHNKSVYDICNEIGINRFQGYYFYEPKEMLLGKFK